MGFIHFKRVFVLAGILFGGLFLFGSQYFSRPRVWAPNDVPVAFWAWRYRSPAAGELRNAFISSGKTLFLHAGQFDTGGGAVRRTRPVEGALPASVELHLVYNCTRRFLQEFEQFDEGRLAETVADTYRIDLVRAHKERTELSGLQLDFDVPERLLPHYAKLLQRLHGLLPRGAKLSISGLPAWLATEQIKPVLDSVDFWAPQCYGGTIPTRVDQRIPISSPADVERTIQRVRELGKPFYAGLSAYGYAILYDGDGRLVELRGNVDPALGAIDERLQLIEAQPFKGGAEPSEIRYVYRAKSDLVIDGLIMRPGETLVIDQPTSASLQASARAVRENAGEPLLGICVFRLPTTDDSTTLTAAEIKAALSDVQTQIATAVTLKKTSEKQFEMRVENVGTARAAMGENAFAIDLAVPAGTVDGVPVVTGFNGYETLCGQAEDQGPQPCASQRANAIRLNARSWPPGANASVTFSLKNGSLEKLPASVITRVDDGRVDRQALEISIENKE